MPELVDIRQLDSSWEKKWNEWSCDWRYLHVEGRQVPSWKLGRLVMEASYPGIIYPSVVKPKGTNIVLFTMNVADVDSMLKPINPEGKYLPKDQSSWG